MHRLCRSLPRGPILPLSKTPAKGIEDTSDGDQRPSKLPTRRAAKFSGMGRDRIKGAVQRNPILLPNEPPHKSKSALGPPFVM